MKKQQVAGCDGSFVVVLKQNQLQNIKGSSKHLFLSFFIAPFLFFLYTTTFQPLPSAETCLEILQRSQSSASGFCAEV